jgi:hypothetical protein
VVVNVRNVGSFSLFIHLRVDHVPQDAMIRFNFFNWR